ncbi:MAG: AAA family ATPase [Myxococcota bacterium]|nr:AAA family ATPase [Myxococcota bacterium]
MSVVTLCIHGIQALALARRTLDQFRGMLDDLAFKRGMRWFWTNDGDSRAIAGLTANPSRAAADAAQLALDVHEAIAGFNEDIPAPVAAALGIVRGIASGTRDAQGHLVDYRLHDPTTYLADALARATPAGQTWVAGGIYRLVRRDFRWGDAPTLQLEGSAAREAPPTMRLYSLERSLSREERLAEVQAGSSELVGRDAEKAELHAAYHLALSGGRGAGHLVCRALVGEMGIGKTALASAFLAELPPNTRLIHVECTPVRMEVPYATIAELIRVTIGTTGEEPFEEVASLIAGAGGGAASGDGTSPMVARLAELATNRLVAGGDEDAHSRKKTILAGVRNLLAAVALNQPLVLVVESVHWSDKASIEVLHDFAHGSDPLPVFVLVVTRHDERVAHFLEGLTRIDLRGLAPTEQVRLVQTRLGVSDGAEQVCAELLPKAAGNPFFLLELIDASLERGALEIREGDADEQGERSAILAHSERPDAAFRALPSTLEQLLGDRIRELPASERRVVEWLAIAGGPLALVDVLRLTEETEEEAIVRLCARGLCDRKGELVDFRHALTRDVAYVELPPADRVRLHRKLGEHLAGTSLARGVSAAIVGRHLARGESYERAAEFYFEAATAARSSHQTAMAIRYFQRSLAHMRPDDARRMETHEALESAYRMLGRKRERKWHLQELKRIVRQIGTPRAVCLGLLRTGRYDFDEGRLAHGALVAQRAGELARASNVAELEVEAESLMSDFLRELGDVQGALAASDRALAACHPAVHGHVPPRLRGEVLRSRGILLRRVGRVREAVDAHVDAIAIFKRSGARRGEARVKNSLAYSMFVQGRYEDAIALALESIQIDLSIGGRFQIAKTLTTIGHTYFRLGDVPRALAYLARARAAHDRYGDQDGWAETLLVSALVATETRDFAAAESYARDAGALIAATENAYDRTYESVVRALLARACGQSQRAADHAVAARRSAESMALVAFHFYAMAIEAASRVDLGELHAATVLATTALGAVENLQGCEYELEIRMLCAEGLDRAGSPQAFDARKRMLEHANALMQTVRDARLRSLFPQRPLNAALLRASRPKLTTEAPPMHFTNVATAASTGGPEGA